MQTLTPQRFTYHRTLAPMLWTMFALSLVEVPLLHLVVQHWSPPIAWTLSAIGGLVALAVAALAVSVARTPVVIDEAGLRLRLGWLYDATLSWRDIAAISPAPSPTPPTRRKDVLPAFAGAANVRITLHAPRRLVHRLKGARLVVAADLQLDEPGAFLAAVRPWVGG